MLECWKTEPEERPDFQTVEEKLRKILMDRVGGVHGIRALDLIIKALERNESLGYHQPIYSYVFE